MELEHKLFQETNRSAWFALSVASSPEEALARKEAFEKLPTVERVVEVASKIPLHAEGKRPIVERIHNRLANLPRQVPEIPVTEPAELDRMLAGAETMLASVPEAARSAAELRQMRELLRRYTPDEYRRRVSAYQQAMAVDLLGKLRELQAASTVEPPRPSDLPECVACRFIGKNGKYLLQVFSKGNIWDVGPMGRFVHDVRSVDPEITGNPLQVYEASRQMKRSFEHAAWYALLVIVPLVFLDFRRLGHTLLAMLPMSLGMLLTIGLMGLLDIPLNQANMIFIPLIIGIGIEDGIHLLHDMRRQGRRYRGADNAVIVSVVVTSLTTMVGFGALMIANHRGLQSLGRVLTLSMGCCLLTSLLLPNLLRLGGFAADGAPEQETDADNADGLVFEEELEEEEPPLPLAA